ncbi:MAG: MATE family efflux transporter [Muribaculaceae bacterium]|nr:MATE family efflux transporter [Muribaculaceae bacterium]
MAQSSDDKSPLTLGTAPVSKLLVQYSVPAIIASVATSLYNIIDSIFIGQGVNAMAISGLAITFPLMNLVMAFVTLIAAGGSAISSIFLGQKDVARATDVVNNVMSLSVISSLLVGGFGLWYIDEVLELFGATPETITYAREFMIIVLAFTPLFFVFIGLNNVMRATGYPKKAMISALFSVAVNLILAPIFIFKFKWGISGAALATVCGQTVAFIWVMIHFLSPKSYVRLNIRGNWFSWSIIRRIYAIGLSPFLMNVCACVVVVFINKSLLSYGGADGNLCVGAYGIINRVTMLFVMVVFGVTQGMQPILGFNYGAGQWCRVKHTLNIGIWVGLILTTIGGAIGLLLPAQVSRMFTVDQTLIEISRNGFHVYYTCIFVVGVQIVIQNFFQSIGKPSYSIFLSMTRQLLFLIPFLILFPPKWGVDGVWGAMAASDMLAFLTAIATLWVVMRKLNRQFQNIHPSC